MITLTESAAAHIVKSLEKRGKGIGIRVGIKSSGCSGMSYTLEFADAVTETDDFYEAFGTKVIVDVIHLPYLTGMTLDYTREGLQEGFKFDNPNAQAACGCGESFTI
jgi:iron-sulfur cluster assembly protein